MEKFTKWEDKSNGINPFVEVKPSRCKGKSAPAQILNAVLKLFLVLLVPFRFILFSTTLSLALLFDTIAILIPINILKRIIRRIFVAPLCRLTLLLLGFIRIVEAIPDHRRLRLGKRVGKDVLSKLHFTTVQAGDAVLCSSTNFAEILYLNYRFSPAFGLMDLPNGRKISTCGLFGALRRATWSYRSEVQRSTEGDIETVKEAAGAAKKGYGAPLVVLAEVVRTNGLALLQFGECVGGPLPERTHLIGFKYTFQSLNPCHTAQGLWSYLGAMLLQFTHSMTVSYIPHELCAERQKSDKAVAEEEKSSSGLRDILALGVGDRGVKTVSLGAKEYFAFLDYYQGEGKKDR